MTARLRDGAVRVNWKAAFGNGLSDIAAVFAGPLLGLLVLTACSAGVLDPSVLDQTSSTPSTASSMAKAVSEDAPSEDATPPPELSVAAARSATSGAASYADDPEAVARGRGLFRAVCTGYCHSTRPADRVAPDLFDCGWARGDSDPEIFRTISDGVPDTQMQGFGGKISDEDLWKIVAYLRSASKCGEDAA